MKKRDKPLLVNKKAFDEVLAKLIESKPLPRTKVEATGRRGSNKPLLAKP